MATVTQQPEVDVTPCYVAKCATCGQTVGVTVADPVDIEQVARAVADVMAWQRIGCVTVPSTVDRFKAEPFGHRVGCMYQRAANARTRAGR